MLLLGSLFSVADDALYLSFFVNSLTSDAHDGVSLVKSLPICESRHSDAHDWSSVGQQTSLLLLMMLSIGLLLVKSFLSDVHDAL